MERGIVKWEQTEFNDVKDYGSLYQHLSLFKYGKYSDDIREVVRKRKIMRDVGGNLVIIEFSNRQISYSFQLNDKTVTKPIASRKLPYFRYSRKVQNELVLLLAEAETNARVNFPKSAEEFVPLRMPDVVFSED